MPTFFNPGGRTLAGGERMPCVIRWPHADRVVQRISKIAEVELPNNRCKSLIPHSSAPGRTRLQRLRKTFIRSGFGKDTTSVVPISTFQLLSRAGLKPARNLPSRLFRPASLAANRFLQIGAVEIAPFPILIEQSHSFFRCFSLVSDLAAAFFAIFTGDGGTVPV